MPYEVLSLKECSKSLDGFIKMVRANYKDSEKEIFMLKSLLLIIVVIVIVVSSAGFLKKKSALNTPVPLPEENHKGHWKEFSEKFIDQESAEEAAAEWDDQQLRLFITEYIFFDPKGSEDWRPSVILSNLEDKTHPIVLQILKNKEMYRHLVYIGEDERMGNSPFKRACKILRNTTVDNYVSIMSPFAECSLKYIRADAILEISKTGDIDSLPYIRQALSSNDYMEQEYATMGMSFVLKQDKATPEFKNELYSIIYDLIQLGGFTPNDSELLLYQLSPEKAKAYFLTDEMFNAENFNLNSILGVLAGAGEQVPREKIKSLIASLETKPEFYPYPDAIGKAVLLLGCQKQPEDREYIEDFMNHSNHEIASGASEGLLALLGISDVSSRIWEIQKESGFESLNQHQQYYSAVLVCDAEVRNGGFAQYYYNSSGDRWPVALAGFEAMGLVNHQQVLMKSLENFGTDGPSTDNVTRREQLDKLFESDESNLGSLDIDYYDVEEVVEVYMTRFVLAYPESFQ